MFFGLVKNWPSESAWPSILELTSTPPLKKEWFSIINRGGGWGQFPKNKYQFWFLFFWRKHVYLFRLSSGPASGFLLMPDIGGGQVVCVRRCMLCAVT